jgi:hypothetical protein
LKSSSHRSILLRLADFGHVFDFIAVVVTAEIYNWFTEGFDTADLKEAKALLDELRH